MNTKLKTSHVHVNQHFNAVVS